MKLCLRCGKEYRHLSKTTGNALTVFCSESCKSSHLRTTLRKTGLDSKEVTLLLERKISPSYVMQNI